MKISFFIPESSLPNQKQHSMGTIPSWIYQTWLLLQTIGISCDLVSQVPKEGIVIVHGNSSATFLNDPHQLPKDLFIVDVVADEFPHPAAHCYLVQNRAHAKRLPRSLFIPHWPQPNLIPRNPERGNQFENISFLGTLGNCDVTILSEEWNDRLRREVGVYFEYKKDPIHWHDYSTTDCILAIRDFSRSQHFYKPATKLYNAWLAEVPFIGGRDSAYATDGHPGKDYLRATSLNQVVQYLQRLKEDHAFRASLVHQGQLSGEAFTRQATLERWQTLVQKTLPLLASHWLALSPSKRRIFSLTQQAFCCFDYFFA
ncbi:MAG: hypothetical protein A3F67_09680 [Verrucomicrobia bacterium RIFCSPHIGHO2_12_FULL_41_10]|nr:MAG: hypothetical protein A3F67_09680 [Verrucomicrobia bacterium RIFCSPHIGHO2_12_FULL_41_10]HLB33700.1 hypothetical protein [Chthoniobacterales bacterium]